MTSAILFPHTHITNTETNRISAHFDQLVIYQPWHMEAPCPEADDRQKTFIRIEYPPQTMKPHDNFKKLIQEYKLWLEQNRDKGFRPFLLAGQEPDSAEDTSWKIRRLFSQTLGEKKTAQDKTLTTQWHLILYLAREFEESLQEAERLLIDLKNQKSPLAGALEEDPAEHFFDHTGLQETKLRVDDNHLKQVFEAWFGLFGDSIPDEAPLITLDPMVLYFASERFASEEKLIVAGSAEGDAPKTGEQPYQSVILPSLEKDDSRLKNAVIKALSGRTIILMKA